MLHAVARPSEHWSRGPRAHPGAAGLAARSSAVSAMSIGLTDTQPFPTGSLVTAPLLASLPLTRSAPARRVSVVVSRDVPRRRRGRECTPLSPTFSSFQTHSMDRRGFPEATQQRQVPAKPFPPTSAAPFSVAIPRTEKIRKTQGYRSANPIQFARHSLSPIRDRHRNVGGFQFAVSSVSVSPHSWGSRGPRDGCSWPGNTLGCEVLFMASSPGHRDPPKACSRFRAFARIINPVALSCYIKRLASHLLQLPLHCNLADA